MNAPKNVRLGFFRTKCAATVIHILFAMAENQLPEAVVQKLDPNRRKFILGILAAGITAPTVASFALGKAQKTSVMRNAIRPTSIIDASGNFNIRFMDSSGNSQVDFSANSLYEEVSGNFLRDASGNFELDPSGNLLCGTSGNVLLDGSGNIQMNPDFSGNVWLLDPSGNWSYDISSNGISIPFRDASGNAYANWLQLDPSGNAFTDPLFIYDSNGVYIPYGSPQLQGVACVVSANHVRQIQNVPSSTTSTTTAPATTTTVPVASVTPNGTIPATK